MPRNKIGVGIVSNILLFSIFFIFLTDSYIVKQLNRLNGKDYLVIEDQPFFRVYHLKHFKVFRPNSTSQNQEELHNSEEDGASSIVSTSQSQRSTPRFGHHHLPSNEKKTPIYWPMQLLPFMSCMDLICLCPLFSGVVRQTSPNTTPLCILPNGQPLKKAIRKEFRTLTTAERTQFVQSMRKLKNSGLYTLLGSIHRRYGVHAGPGFFPWHREFIKRLEITYRIFDSEMGLPYWDSTLDNNLPNPADSIMFSKFLMGDTDDDGNVVSGLFTNWTTLDGRATFNRKVGKVEDGEFLNDARIDFVLNQTSVDRVLAYSLPLHSCINYELEERFLEYSHDYVHYYISGDMLERYSSSNDPLFFMHHGFIDFIWETWRQTKQTRKERETAYPADNGECMPIWHFSFSIMNMFWPQRNIDGLSNAYTDNLYEYAPRPSCVRDSNECNSEFLFCDNITNHDQPKCTTKVKSGGNCTGFEWSTDVCYISEERCIDGFCTVKSSSNVLKPLKSKNDLQEQQKLVKKLEKNSASLEEKFTNSEEKQRRRPSLHFPGIRKYM